MLFILGDIINLLLSFNARTKKKAYNLGATGATEEITLFYPRMMFRTHSRPYYRVVTWYMGSGLKVQNMTGIRAQRKRLRAQKNGIRDHKAFEPDSGIRLLHGLKISYHNIFPHNKVCVHRISLPRYITYSCFRLAAVPVIRSPGCLTKTWYHILNLLIVEGTVI